MAPEFKQDIRLVERLHDKVVKRMSAGCAARLVKMGSHRYADSGPDDTEQLKNEVRLGDYDRTNAPVFDGMRKLTFAPRPEEMAPPTKKQVLRKQRVVKKGEDISEETLEQLRVMNKTPIAATQTPGRDHESLGRMIGKAKEQRRQKRASDALADVQE
jgi:hypothetical protein